MYFDNSKIAGLIVAFMAVGEVAVPFLIWFALAYREIFPEIKEKYVKAKKKARN